jgi:hypothetical protein
MLDAFSRAEIAPGGGGTLSGRVRFGTGGAVGDTERGCGIGGTGGAVGDTGRGGTSSGTLDGGDAGGPTAGPIDVLRGGGSGTAIDAGVGIPAILDTLARGIGGGPCVGSGGCGCGT